MEAKPFMKTGLTEPFGFSKSSAGPPVGKLGHLQHRVHLKRDSLQLAVCFQRRDELAQIGVSHGEFSPFYYD
jgi:hypothetical protein